MATHMCILAGLLGLRGLLITKNLEDDMKLRRQMVSEVLESSRKIAVHRYDEHISYKCVEHLKNKKYC